MGDPKKQHKHYDSVKLPWDKDRITQEKKIVQKYGIRRKRELRKAETVLRNLRHRARNLIGIPNKTEENMLIKKVSELGLADQNATLDNILSLKVDSILERRLETILLKKELANTPLQARQFITHGHIAIDGIKVVSPSYMVRIHEENKIDFVDKSSLNSTFKVVKREEKKETRQEGRRPRREGGRREPRESREMNDSAKKGRRAD